MTETVRHMLIVAGMAVLFFGTCIERDGSVGSEATAEVANLMRDQAVQARLYGLGADDAGGVARLEGTPDELHLEAEAIGLDPGTYRLWMLGPGTCSTPERLAGEPALRLTAATEEEQPLVPTWTVLPDPADQAVPALFTGQGTIEDAESGKDLLGLVGTRVVIELATEEGASVRGEPVLCGEVRALPRTVANRAAIGPPGARPGWRR